ncbi:unnamed protein product [Trichobilharzia szidati]|nr:unnamed protein product [Trichobilharzia szidati]
MSQPYVALPYRSEERKRSFTTLSLICDDESLSDAQLKAYQTRLQEYRTFLDAVSRLALCGNVCVTEEAVTIGEHGLLTGESLNALQHAGAISVYNTLQQNNWEFPISEEGEVAIVKAHVPIPDEFLDSEKPIRSDWPAVHISECFVEGERAKLHGSVRPLRTFLPPTIVFRNAADVDEDVAEPEVNIINSGPEGSIEIVQSSNGLSVKKAGKDGKGVEYIPIDKYYFGRQSGNTDYAEEKSDFRFKCAVCQRIFYSNTKLMSHILGHVDEESQACLDTADTTQCTVCHQTFSCAFDLRDHIEKEHTVLNNDPNSTGNESQLTASGQAASQLVAQRSGDNPDDPSNAGGGGNVDSNNNGTMILAPNLNGITNTPSCRICGKAAVNEILLAHHLQSTHRQCEMPYVCRLCLFRSSMYEDILDHFKKVHDGSNHLLCTYCLRIFTPSDARSNVQSMSASGGVNSVALGLGIGQTQVYLQHLRMHQIKHQLRRCPTCRLNFTNKSDYQVHRRLDHKATRGPGIEKQELRQDSYELESYRVSMSNNNTSGQSIERDGENTTTTTTHNNNNTISIGSVRIIRQQITSMNAPEAGCAKSLAVNFYPKDIDKLECLECGKCMNDAEHAQYLPCSLCRFATCCRAGFQRHYEKLHIYANPSQSQDIDSGMPMIRQVYFDWSTPPPPSTTTTTATTTAESNEISQYHEEKNTTVVTTTTEQTPSIVISNGQEYLVINEITDLTPNNNDGNNLPTDITNNEMNTATMLTSEQSRNDASMINYMQNQIDSRLFYCSHCGANQLDGNSLARHLVEECGTLTATLNPDPYLLISQSQTSNEAEQPCEEEGGEQQQQHLHEGEPQQQQQEQQELAQNENNVVFDATNQNLVVIRDPSLLSTAGGVGGATAAGVTDGDVIMMTVDGDQLSSMQLVEPTGDDNQTALLTGTQMMTQMTTNGTTTIDVTDAGGEVVQQFVLPDDLQLEEGQTLIMIQDENGQPQLAIVNQADLINANSSEILMQTEDDQANNIIIYTNGLEGQAQLSESVQLVRTGEEEKENQQQFIV